MKVIVAGSREYNDFRTLRSKLDLFLSKAKDKDEKITIISGKARGADYLGEQYALINNYEIEEFPADWDDLDHPQARIKVNKYGKQYNAHAGHIRNEKMARAATHLVAFIDLSLPCAGTRNMIDLATKYKLHVRVVYSASGVIKFDKIPKHT